MVIGTSKYETVCEGYVAALARLKDAKEKMENLQFKKKKQLNKGESTGDKFLDMCIFEYEEDFRGQFDRMKQLEMLLKEHEGQLVQIVENCNIYYGERAYKKSSIGIIGGNPLEVKENKDRAFLLGGIPKYSLLFNFNGTHIFYREAHSIFSERRGSRSYSAQFKLTEEPAKLGASSFREMEFGTQKLKSKNRIYIGNRALVDILGLWDIEASTGIKSIRQLYEFIKPHVKGLRDEKEEKRKPIIWLGKAKV